MIKVTVGNNVSRQSDFVDENTTTLKTVLEKAEIDYSRGMTTLNGATLAPGDINKTFAEMGIKAGVNDSCYLLNVVKADNAIII